jgi:hypothetical protein
MAVSGAVTVTVSHAVLLGAAYIIEGAAARFGMSLRNLRTPSASEPLMLTVLLGALRHWASDISRDLRSTFEPSLSAREFSRHRHYSLPAGQKEHFRRNENCDDDQVRH